MIDKCDPCVINILEFVQVDRTIKPCVLHIVILMNMLATDTVREDNQVLDRIMRSRRSVRQFKPDPVPRTKIEEIIQAGLLAPCAKAAVTREDFRRFVVVPRESEATQRLSSLIQRRATVMFNNLGREMHMDEYVRNRGAPWLERLKRMSEHGPPNLGKAPYFIVIAEERGIPAVEEASLAHCLQNMWLKATALGLGFQLISITEQMSEDEEFCQLIGIPGEEFLLNGCIIGYAEVSPPPTQRPSMDKVMHWL